MESFTSVDVSKQSSVSQPGQHTLISRKGSKNSNKKGSNQKLNNIAINEEQQKIECQDYQNELKISDRKYFINNEGVLNKMREQDLYQNKQSCDSLKPIESNFLQVKQLSSSKKSNHTLINDQKKQIHEKQKVIENNQQFNILKLNQNIHTNQNQMIIQQQKQKKAAPQIQIMLLSQQDDVEDKNEIKKQNFKKKKSQSQLVKGNNLKTNNKQQEQNGSDCEYEATNQGQAQININGDFQTNLRVPHLQLKRRNSFYDTKKCEQNGNDTENISKHFNYQTWKFQRDQIALQYFKEENLKLRKALYNTKIFLNMVVHDLRNPTNQINFSLQYVVDILNNAQMVVETISKLKKEQLIDIWKNVIEFIKDLDDTIKRLKTICENLSSNNIRLKIENKQLKQSINHYKTELEQKNKKISDLEIEILECGKQMSVANEDVIQKEVKIFMEYQNQAIANFQIQISKITEEQSDQNLNRKYEDNKKKIESYIDQIKQNQQQFQNQFFQDFSNSLVFSHAIKVQNQMDQQIFVEDNDGHLQYVSSISSESESNDKDFDFDQSSDIILTTQRDKRKSLKQQISQLQNFDQQKLSFSVINFKNQEPKINSMYEIKNNYQISNHDNNSGPISLQIPLQNGQNSIKKLSTKNPQKNEKNQILKPKQKQFTNTLFLQQVNQQHTLKSESSKSPYDQKDFPDLSQKIMEKARIWEQKIENIFKGNIFGEQSVLDSKEMIQGCKHSAMMLSTLLDDLLDLAKHENVTFQLNKSYFNLNEVVQNVFKILEFLSIRKKCKLNFNINPLYINLLKKIYGDQKRYEQILLNFVSNALKFSNEKGNVDVIVEINQLINTQDPNNNFNDQQWENLEQKQYFQKIIEEFNENQEQKLQKQESLYDLHLVSNKEKFKGLKRTNSIINQISKHNNLVFIKFVIKVVDTGYGISQEGLKSLFKDFSSLKEHQNDNQGGTGLGLSICKKIIENMGGNVSVQSKIDQGTTFRIELTTLCQVSKTEADDIKKSSTQQIFQQSDTSSQSCKITYIEGHENSISKIQKEILDQTDNFHYKTQFLSESSQELTEKNNSYRNDKNNIENIQPKYSSFKDESLQSFSDKFVTVFENKIKYKHIQQEEQKEFLEQRLQSLNNSSIVNRSIQNQDSNIFNSQKQIIQNDTGIIKTNYMKSPMNQKNTNNKYLFRKCQQIDMNEISRDNQTSIQFQDDLNYQVESPITNHENIHKELSYYSFATPSLLMTNLKLKENDEENSENGNCCQMMFNSNSKENLDNQIIQKNNISTKQITQKQYVINQQDAIILEKYYENAFKNKNLEQDSDNQLKQERMQQFHLFPKEIPIKQLRKFYQNIQFLIVNDDCMQLMILESILKTAVGLQDINIHKAENGLIAYQKVIKGNFDVVLMDINMPVMGGFQSSKKMNDYFSEQESDFFLVGISMNNPMKKQKKPYIVALSASDIDDEMLLKCQMAGFDDQFTSPLTASEIEENIIDKLFFLNQIKQDEEQDRTYDQQDNQLSNIIDNQKFPFNRIQSSKSNVQFEYRNSDSFSTIFEENEEEDNCSKSIGNQILIYK